MTGEMLLYISRIYINKQIVSFSFNQVELFMNSSRKLDDFKGTSCITIDK